MSRLEQSTRELQSVIASMKQELADVKHEKEDLELLVEMITTHGDYIENKLLHRAEFAEEEFRKCRDELKSLCSSELTAANKMLSEMKLRLREILRRESVQDPLTSLYSRRYMEKSLEQELSRCKRHSFPLAVIMVDIDRFRSFNDRYGYAIGDVVLQKLGEFLKTHVREEDIACRYGDEEFMLILLQASLQNAKKRAEQIHVKVREDLKAPYQNNMVGITVSMGIAGFPEHGTKLTEILGAANLALYEAKGKGLDQIQVAVNSVYNGTV